jgi:predicted ATPase/DNA-binding winged helix-turn-helix (wHTH) protein
MYLFGDYVLDTQLFQLRRKGEVIPLEPKVFDVLRYLVEHHDRVATKRELLDSLWPNEVVTEAVLPTNINALRRALGQRRGDKLPIETVHGRGYRFAMPVTRSLPPKAMPSSEPPPQWASLAPLNDVEEQEPFVGRVQLMNRLKRSLARVLGDQGQICVLSGEAGIGKTRAAQRLADLARAHGAEVWMGPCHEGEGAPAFWPWAQVLKSALYSEGVETLRGWLGPSAPDVVQWIPELAEGLDQGVAVASTFEHASFRALDAVSRLLVAASRARPRVVFLEDMHRADDASWQLLRLLAPTLERSAVLVLVTLRSRDDLTVAAPVERNVDALARMPSCHRFYLRGLEESETGELARKLLGEDLPEHVVRTLHDKTGGNPLFVRELVDWIEARGGAPTEIDATPDLAPPEVVRHVLRRRVTRLGEQGLRVLQAAAVVGPMWDAAIVEKVTGLARDKVLSVIDQAVEQRIVMAVPTRVDAYRFAHDLLRDTLYADLPTAYRKRLHLLVAVHLEERTAWLGAEAVREIAHHLYQALPDGDTARAISWLRHAAELSEESHAFEDAARYYRCALDATRMLPAADPALSDVLADARSRALESARRSRSVS